MSVLVPLIQHGLNFRLVEIRRYCFVVILKKIVHGDFSTGNTFCGNVDSGRPDDGIQYQPAKLIIAPVPMNVTTTGSKSASAVGTLSPMPYAAVPFARGSLYALQDFRCEDRRGG